MQNACMRFPSAFHDALTKLPVNVLTSLHNKAQQSIPLGSKKNTINYMKQLTVQGLNTFEILFLF